VPSPLERSTAYESCLADEALYDARDIAASSAERFFELDLLIDAGAAAAAEEPPPLGGSLFSSSSLLEFFLVGDLLFFIRFIDALVRVWLVSASFCR
jgi:hypothetical protein